MSDRTCEKCGAVFAAPCRLRRHMQRKTPCAPIAKTHDLPVAEQKRPMVCKFCNHRFTSRQGLSYHMRHTCKIAGSESGMQKLYEHTLQEMKKMQRRIDKLEADALAVAQMSDVTPASRGGVAAVHNLTTAEGGLTQNILHADHVHNHNNLTINIFGSEDVSYLGQSEIRAILDKALRLSPKDPMKAAKHALTEIGYSVYSNPEHPENITCYVPNKKHEHVLVHTGARWELRSSSEVTPEMYARSMNIMFVKQPFEDSDRYAPLMLEARDREHDPKFAGELHRGYRALLVENKSKLRKAEDAQPPDEDDLASVLRNLEGLSLDEFA